MQKIITSYYYFLPIVILCAFYLFKSYFFPIHDFGNYYFGSLLFKLNQFSTEVYAPAYFNSTIHELGYNFLGTYLPFTPITTVFFYPLTFFKPLVAKLLFNGFSIFLFLNTLNKIFNYLKLNYKYLLILPLIFFVPIKNGILFGQFYILLFVLITETYIFYKKNKKWKSAILLSIAIAVKISPILIVFWFFSLKDWKQVLRILSIGVLMFGISLIVNGTMIWHFYVIEILKPSLDGAMGLDFQTNQQSVHVFLKHLFVKDSYFNPNPFTANYNLYFQVLFFYKAIILSVGILMSYIVKNDTLRFGLWIFIILLLSPNGSTYSLILLLFLLIAILSEKSVSIIKIMVSIIFIFLISNIPWNVFYSDYLVLKFIRLSFILIFFMILILWYFKKVPIPKSILIFSTVLIFYFLKPIPKQQKGDTIYGGKSIINNYKIENGNLIIEEFTFTGTRSKKIKEIEIKQSNDHITLKDNQLYLNDVQITNSNDYKFNPTIVNDKVFFLSDYNQGYKFYNLRQISITKK